MKVWMALALFNNQFRKFAYKKLSEKVRLFNRSPQQII